MKLVNMQFPPLSCYLLPLRLKYLPQHPILSVWETKFHTYTRQQETTLLFRIFQSLCYWTGYCGQRGTNDYYDITPLQFIYNYMPSTTLSNNCKSSWSVTSGDKFGENATTERKNKYKWTQKSVKK